MLGSELIEEPCLRIEEVEGLLEVDLLRYHRSPAILHEVVDSASDTVVDKAVLEVGEEVEARHYLIVRLDEAREIGLIGLVFVVALIGLYEVRVGCDEKALAVVVARIVVG